MIFNNFFVLSAHDFQIGIFVQGVGIEERGREQFLCNEL